MAAFIFNQADGTPLSAISATWVGDVSTLVVQSSKLQDILAGIYAAKTAYLNEAGSSYSVAKYSALQSGESNTFIRSSTGLFTTGYSFQISSAGTSGNLRRNNTTVGTYAFTAGHSASTTATEIRIEQVAPDVKVYGGPIGAAVLIGTYTDPSPISGGFSGFQMSGNGTVTPSITAFDNGVSSYTYARPTSDITTQWTPSSGTDHYALIDEATANDADYIIATAAGQTDEVRLASMTAPQSGTDLLINYKVTGIVGSASVTVSLRQGSGGTLIATDTAKSIDNTYQLVVPAATWASVTDWTDLRLRFVSA